jgi:phosphoribosylanthranilate isomerase
MVYTKICGITHVSALQVCIENGADALGFVVGVPESPRNLSERQAIELISKVPPSLHTVIVTSVYSLDGVEYIARRFPKSRIQIHFRCRYPRFEDLYMLDLQRIIPVMSASQIITINLNFPGMQKVLTQVPYLLLDGSLGKGRLEDTDVAIKAMAKLQPCKSVLAGGLTISNISVILQNIHPHGVDVSSGVEDAPGVKNISKIKTFLTITKNFEGRKVSVDE